MSSDSGSNLGTSKSRCALVVTDMLNDFLDPRGALFCGEAGRAIVPVVAARIDKARRLGEPVIYIMDEHRPDDREFEMFPPHCVAGTRGAAVADELRPREGDILIPKRRYSAFFGTDLDLYLRELGVKELVLVGVCTNICVYFTALDARMLGYEVTVLRDGVASFDEEAHRFALEQMKSVLGVKLA